MNPTVDAFLQSWPSNPWLGGALLLAAGVYLRGWFALYRRSRGCHGLVRAVRPSARCSPREPSPRVGGARRVSRGYHFRPQRLADGLASTDKSVAPAGGWHSGKAAAFVGGLAVVYVALASPIETFASLLLQVHMVQHVLLMMLAPPLLWLGDPLFPLLRGLPRSVRTGWFAPLLRSPVLRGGFARATHPCFALALFVAATWLWHVPVAYEAALRDPGWHYLQHACFFGTALLFWYPVVRPYPSRPAWSAWLVLPCLLLADVQNTVLSALLTFSDRVVYSTYASGPHLAGLSPLEDQAVAGVIMWVPGSLAYLLPLFAIAIRLMSGKGLSRAAPANNALLRKVSSGKVSSNVRSRYALSFGATSSNVPSLFALSTVAAHDAAAARPVDARLSAPATGGWAALPVLNSAARSPTATSPAATALHRRAAFDLLRVPALGRLLRWRRFRTLLQTLLLLLAAAIVYDGFRGPQAGGMNLAGVLPWIHWRGLAVLGLLVAGNVFCMACPFTLPRTLARRWLPARHNWPHWLRSKWLVVVLVIVYLWAYEAFSLWDSPWWTAWIALGYFVAAFLVDGFFRGASFCKYVCPVGQFNFVQSLMSPLEVKVRRADVCQTCRTHDCIRGNEQARGCELELFQPRKSGNLDCTFCLDCVHACPHENVGLLAGPPARDLWRDRIRSGVGLLARRADVAALVVVLVFGAFANAAGMIAPVRRALDAVQRTLELQSSLPLVSAFYALTLVLLPAIAVGGAALLSRRFGGLSRPWIEVAARFSFALAPLGFGMWLAHYSFHLLTSWDVAIPVSERFAAGLGLPLTDAPQWACACCRPVGDWLLKLEILMLDCGMLLSLYTAYRIARDESPRGDSPRGKMAAVLAPWALLILLLFLAGLWIVFQPMEMRGTMMTGMG